MQTPGSGTHGFDSNIFHQQTNKISFRILDGGWNFHGKRKLNGAKKLAAILLVNYKMD